MQHDSSVEQTRCPLSPLSPQLSPTCQHRSMCRSCKCGIPLSKTQVGKVASQHAHAGQSSGEVQCWHSSVCPCLLAYCSENFRMVSRDFVDGSAPPEECSVSAGVDTHLRPAESPATMINRQDARHTHLWMPVHQPQAGEGDGSHANACAMLPRGTQARFWRCSRAMMHSSRLRSSCQSCRLLNVRVLQETQQQQICKSMTFSITRASRGHSLHRQLSQRCDTERTYPISPVWLERILLIHSFIHS